MAKNILLFSDGTGQAGGLRPDQALSNIYKLYRACRPGPDSPIDPSQQVAFYDAGLGTVTDEGKIPFRPLQLYRKLLSSATGTGISRNIADCYEAVLKHYEPGDRVFLFGFSRGAYTARCVGGVMSYCGIPTVAADGSPLPRFGDALRSIADEAVKEVYEHGSGKHPDSKYTAERMEKARRFREKYQSAAATVGADATTNRANVVPHFIGVFDTVAALGAPRPLRWLMTAGLLLVLAVLAIAVASALSFLSSRAFWPIALSVGASSGCVALYFNFQQNFKSIRDFPSAGDYSWHFVSWRLRFYNTFLNKRVMYARHAMAIDEDRRDFPRVRWDVEGELVQHPPELPIWMKQVWFAGNHSDIGGSYPEDEARLSDIALNWMVEEARALPSPLIVDDAKLHLFPSPDGMQHCEISSMRDRYPRWWPRKLQAVWSRQMREVLPAAVLHPTVLRRFAIPLISKYGIATPYRPPNLAQHNQTAHYY